jgi:hypothetical protein
MQPARQLPLYAFAAVLSLRSNLGLLPASSALPSSHLLLFADVDGASSEQEYRAANNASTRSAPRPLLQRQPYVSCVIVTPRGTYTAVLQPEPSLLLGF